MTLKQVAERAGVSRAAVSRTYTKGASVSARTRAKVEEAAQALGYSPNILARSLTTGQTQMIGLVSNNFHNPAFLQIFDLFTRGLQERGLRPLLINLTDETDPARSVQLLRSYSVDGVVLASSELPPGFAEAFAQTGLPVVHAFGRAGQAGAVNVVGIDNVRAGQMAAQTLLARGYRKIGFLGGPATASTTQDRLKGFREGAGEAASIAYSFGEAYSFTAGRDQMARSLRGPHVEAYFCADDVLTIGALAAARDAGLVVPRDIGLIGLNDMEMSGWGNIDLTTIHQPFGAIIDASVDLMMSALADPERLPEARVFECHIVERGTLRPLP